MNLNLIIILVVHKAANQIDQRELRFDYKYLHVVNSQGGNYQLKKILDF